jgi:tetratricopeptide (TPR) repeat protein
MRPAKSEPTRRYFLPRLTFQSLTFLAAALAVFATSTTWAHEGEDESSHLPPLILGILDFPNSGSDDAQDAFDRGVKLLHSFEFDDARAAFLEAQSIDPGFAMAIWGEAMTLNHPLWAQQDRETALEVLAKLPLPAARKTTAREERYLDAVFVLYGEGDKPSRDRAYRDAMRQMYEDYPDDLEAAAFYSLSVLGSVYERDFRTYMKAASIAEEVFARQPKHPGAAHYLIHSYDDQVHAPLGLRAARAYSKIAPAASHAQHMVSHIYTSLGMWDEVVEANNTAVRVSEESMQRSGRDVAMRSKHALHWLEYALLQQGRFDEARDALQMMKEDVAALPNAGNRRHNAMLRASYAVEDPLAPRILMPTDTTGLSLYDYAIDRFSTAFVAIAKGNTDTANLELAQLKARIDAAKVLSVEEGLHGDDSATSEDDFLLATIIAREIEALLAFRNGDTDQAIRIMASAVEDENARPLYYGPPHVPKPSNELLGEMLLTLGRPDEAITQFQISLGQNTSKSQSLLGLARAQKAVGDNAATQTWQQVESNWRGDINTIRNLEYTWLASIASSAAPSGD